MVPARRLQTGAGDGPVEGDGGGLLGRTGPEVEDLGARPLGPPLDSHGVRGAGTLLRLYPGDRPPRPSSSIGGSCAIIARHRQSARSDSSLPVSPAAMRRTASCAVAPSTNHSAPSGITPGRVTRRPPGREVQLVTGLDRIAEGLVIGCTVTVHRDEAELGDVDEHHGVAVRRVGRVDPRDRVVTGRRPVSAVVVPSPCAVGIRGPCVSLRASRPARGEIGLAAPVEPPDHEDVAPGPHTGGIAARCQWRRRRPAPRSGGACRRMPDEAEVTTPTAEGRPAGWPGSQPGRAWPCMPGPRARCPGSASVRSCAGATLR